MRSRRTEVVAEMRRLLRRKNEAAGVVIEGNVKRLTPVDSGRLRSSYTHSSDETGCIVGTNTNYAIFVEAGTRYQDPQPHLIPGLLNSADELRRIYGSD